MNYGVSFNFVHATPPALKEGEHACQDHEETVNAYGD